MMKTTKKKAILKKLTKKQRGFVNDYVITENGAQSVLNNYKIKSKINPKNIAAVIAVENLTKPNIIEAIEIKRISLKLALENEGITTEYLAKKVNVLLKAVNEKGQSDYTAIDKGIKHALNIHGVEELDKPKNASTYNFFFNKEVQEEVKEIENRIKLMLINKTND